MSRWDWLGLTEQRWRKGPNEEVRPAKTAWDWIQVAVVPVVLVVIALAFNASQTARDRDRDEKRTLEDRALAHEARLDATLETYLSRMSDLMLDRELIKSRYGSDIRAVARTLTLTTLRRLDGGRKGDVVRFLAESQLLHTDHMQSAPKCADVSAYWRRVRRGLATSPGPILPCVGDASLAVPLADVDLSHADLSGVVLSGAELSAVNLDGTDLRNAKLDDASLHLVSLAGSDMRGASLRRAVVEGSVFTDAELHGAHFDDAYLRTGAVLANPSAPLGLRKYWLMRTSLDGACLAKTSFTRSLLEDVQLPGVEGLGDFNDAKLLQVEGRAKPRDATLDSAHKAPAKRAAPPTAPGRQPC